MIIIQYVLLLIGFILLIKGADYFVEGCISVAKKAKIPPLIIGLTIVAFGTSAPEAAVSIAASIKGSAGIAVGNIVGSNIFNLLVVTGACVLIEKVSVQKETIRRDFPVYLVSILVLLFMTTAVVGQRFVIGRADGIILLVFMAAYIAMLVRSTLKSRASQTTLESETYETMGTLKTTLYIIIGGFAIVAGGRTVVSSASEIAKSFGMSEGLVGLTIVALGTSLPELVTSFTAVKKGEDDMAVGNVIGSNIFNTLFVIGLASAITPITIDYKAYLDILICIGISAVVYLFCIHKRELGRTKGMWMLLMYGLFLWYIIYRN